MAEIIYCLNIEQEKNACNDFGEDFFKLVSISVYVKTIENLRNSVDVRLQTNSKDYQKLVSKPSFVYQKVFNKNLVAIHKNTEVLTLNKPA